MIQAKTVLSIGNKELDEVLFSSPKKVVIYGEAATGKTNILLTILKHSVKELGRDDAIFYISTEGSVFFERALKLDLVRNNIFVAVAVDQNHLIDLVIEIIRTTRKNRPVCIMIDSINNFYRVESSSLEGLTNFAKLLVLLDSFNKSGAWIVSSAQVRYGEEGLPAYEFLYPWADIIINIEREGSFYRVLKFVKPKLDKVFCFGITLSGIRWTTTRI